MRVLIFEPDHEGHRLHYVRTMLPGLMEVSEHVTVALASEAPSSREFAVHLSELAGRVEIDASMPRPAGGGMKTARAKLRELKQSIARSRAEHVYFPYGDGLAQLLGLPGAWRWAIPRGVDVETLLFRGAAAYPQVSVKERLKSRASLAAASRPPWSSLFHLDPVVYEWSKRRGGPSADRLQLMADPVEPPSADDRGTVLRRLGLPDDGRYIGTAGVINRHKGIELFLRAFAAASLPESDRLLLAGLQAPEIRALLAGEFAPLVRAGRIVSLDRVLSIEDFADAIAAMDVVCVPYPHHIGSASIVIRAAAAGRPVLASGFGWSGSVVPRFGLGRITNVNDVQTFAESIARSLNEAGAFRLTESGERFVEFHTPANFRALWTAGLRRRLNLPAQECRSWASVLGAAPVNRFEPAPRVAAPSATQLGAGRA
jgi:glycosyltransferase involved in cell wall biosynthesis